MGEVLRFRGVLFVMKLSMEGEERKWKGSNSIRLSTLHEKEGTF